jgi:malate dehydrogenase (quinone)
VLETCFPDKLAEWRSTLKKIVPSYGTALSENPERAQKSLAATAAKLGLTL